MVELLQTKGILFAGGLAVLVLLLLFLPGVFDTFVLRHARFRKKLSVVIPCSFGVAVLLHLQVLALWQALLAFFILFLVVLSAVFVTPFFLLRYQYLERLVAEGYILELGKKMQGFNWAFTYLDQFERAMLTARSMIKKQEFLEAFEVLHAYSYEDLFRTEASRMRYLRIEILLGLGALAEAREELAQQKPKNVARWKYLHGVLLVKQGLLTSGIQELEEVEEVASEDDGPIVSRSYLLLSALYFQKGEDRVARDNLEEVISQAERDYDLLLGSEAWCCLWRQTKTLEEKKILWERWSLWVNPGDPLILRVHRLLARLEAGPAVEFQPELAVEEEDSAIRDRLILDEKLCYTLLVLKAVVKGGFHPDYWAVKALGLLSDYRRARTPLRYHASKTILEVLRLFRGAPHDFVDTLLQPLRHFMVSRAYELLGYYIRHLPKEAIQLKIELLREQIFLHQEVLLPTEYQAIYQLYGEIKELYLAGAQSYYAWKTHLDLAEASVEGRCFEQALAHMEALEEGLPVYVGFLEVGEISLRIAYCACQMDDLDRAKGFWRKYQNQKDRSLDLSYWENQYAHVIRSYLAPKISTENNPKKKS